MFGTRNGLGSERLTVSSAAVGLASIPKKGGAVYAVMRVKGAAICFTDDGATTPTASVGMEVLDGERILYDAQLASFKAIRRDGTDATLIVNYYGPNS